MKYFVDWLMINAAEYKTIRILLGGSWNHWRIRITNNSFDAWIRCAGRPPFGQKLLDEEHYPWRLL